MLVSLPNPQILSTPYHYSAVWNAPASGRRQAEFAAGRYCASKALALLSADISDDIQIASDGSPLWPVGIIGSITHTEGFVAAAVAKTSTMMGLGIDSEHIADAHVMESVKEVAIQDEEQALLARLPLSLDHGRMLVFCAKESIYKCLYPMVRRSFDFTAARVDAINVADGAFSFFLTETLHADFPRLFRAQGRFEFSHGCVHTGVELKRLP